MLVELKISNFRSFKNEVTFSMEPCTLNGKKKNVIETSFRKVPYVYKTSGIFGANASGKTNIIVALAYLRSVISRGAANNKDDKFPDEHYRFAKEYSQKPSCIQLKFFKNFHLYEYAICLTADKVIYEHAQFWDLSETGTKKANRIFLRDLQEDGSYKFALSKGIKKTWSDELLPQRVFLSDMVNNRQAAKKEVLEIYNFIRQDLCLVSNRGLLYSSVLKKISKNDDTRKEIVNFTKKADLGLQDIVVKSQSKEEFFKEMSWPEGFDQAKKEEMFDRFCQIEAKACHKTEEGSLQETDFDSTESEGTKAYLAISDTVLDVLKNGKVLFIDELDESLHPYLVKNLVNLFNNNEGTAQLIFTSHAHYLMDGDTLTRDQIWFTSKENGFYTELYPLSDFGDDRTRMDFYKSYIHGIYGAVPRVMEL